MMVESLQILSHGDFCATLLIDPPRDCLFATAYRQTDRTWPLKYRYFLFVVAIERDSTLFVCGTILWPSHYNPCTCIGCLCSSSWDTGYKDKRGQDKNPKKIINIPDKLEVNYTHPASHLVRCRTNGAFLEQPLSGRRSTHIP